MPCGALDIGISMLECSSAGAAGAAEGQEAVAAWVEHPPPQACTGAAVAVNIEATSVNTNSLDIVETP